MTESRGVPAPVRTGPGTARLPCDNTPVPDR
jgi:hypothetical protein